MDLKRRVAALVVTLAWTAPAMADIDGSTDHPLLSRFGNATISAYQVSNYDAVKVPGGKIDDGDEATDILELEGRLTRIGYRLPVEHTALEVTRNYETALADGGFTIAFACAGRNECGADFRNYVIRSGEVFAPAFDRAAVNDNFRALLATRADQESTVHIFLFMMEDRANSRTLVRQLVVEGEPLQLGQVSVRDAAALQAALDSDGSVIVDGIFFATDSATLEETSADALEQMADLLLSAPELAVYIVGHTDNEGSLDYNLRLSEQRARAVADALAAIEGIDRARLDPRGVASLAPIASNTHDTGRAQNRRVELVVK